MYIFVLSEADKKMECKYHNRKEMLIDEKIRDVLLPTSGGSIGSLLSVSMGNVIDTLVYASIGAVAGYIIKLLLDYLCLYLKKDKDEDDSEAKGEQESTDSSVSKEDS